MHALLSLLVCASSAALALSHDAFAFCNDPTNPLCGAAQPAWIARYSEAAPGPEQVWLAYGSTPDAMIVGWITADMAAGTIVQYGTSSGSYTNNATGTSAYYTYSAKYTSGLIHHVTLTGLAPATTYYYRCGDDSAWTAEYNFTSNAVGPSRFPYLIGMIGDIGESANAEATIAHLVSNLANWDALTMNGDLSYASGCEADGCTTWDAYQRMMQAVTAYVPMAINLGNHECDDYANGIVAISAQYRLGLKGMPCQGRTDGAMYFSYEAGPAHIISLSSFYPGGFGDSSPMTVFLKADLAAVNRAVTPWLIVIVHAPWYNSNSAHQGDGEGMRQAYEPLFYAAGVNLVTSGHVHAVERSFPSYNMKVDQAKGITYVSVGDAGAGLYTTWLSPQPAWSAFRSAEFGHGELLLINATTAQYTWHRNADGEKIIKDSVYINNPSAA